MTIRKIFVVVIILISLFQVDPHSAEAYCGCRCYPRICPGDSVIDISKLIQFIKEYSQEIILYIRNTNVNINKTAIQINTVKIMYDKTIDRPLKDAMSVIAIQNSSKQIISLINSSTDGNSLVVANPEAAAKNVALHAIQANYDFVSLQNQLYSGDVINTILATTRQENGDAELLSLTQSNIPLTIQKNVCGNDSRLTNVATYNISQNGNVDYTPEQLSSEKQSLQDSVCSGDPTTDTDLAKRLVNLNSQVPSAGGWDTLLQKTAGDNAYTKTIQAVTLVKNNAEKKASEAENDYKEGGGIQSEKTCVKKDSTGECTETIVTKTGSSLRDAYSKANVAGLDANLKSFGKGAVGGGLFDTMSDLLSFAGDAYQSVGYASTLFNSLSGSSATDATLESKRAGSLTLLHTKTATNAPSTQVYSDPSNDPLASASQKANALSNLKPEIQSHIDSFVVLASDDTAYITSVDDYIGKVNGLKQCFDNIETYARANNYIPPYNLPTYEQQDSYSYSYSYGDTPPTQSSVTWYTNELANTISLRTQLTHELQISIPQSRTALTSILTKMDHASTIGEIVSIFNDYQNLLDSDQILSVGGYALREGEKQIFELQVGQKMSTDSRSVGDFTKYSNRCSSIMTRVEGEIYDRDNPQNWGGSF